MTFQWTLVALFLYAEVFIVFLLSLPIIPPRRWSRLFKSGFFTVLNARSSWYFMAVMFTLTLFLVDAIREIKKYSESISRSYGYSRADVRLFRAQRNLYVVGFALFLCFVIRRLVSLITLEAALTAGYETRLEEVRRASAEDKVFVATRNDENDLGCTSDTDNITELQNKIRQLQLELDNARKDKEVAITQSESVSEEYGGSSNEHQKLQILTDADGDKKHA